MFSREYAGKKSWKGVGYIERALYSYRSYLRNVSGYRRYIYIHGLLEFVRLSFPFAHRVYFSYDILLQFSTVRDHLARRIHHQDFIVYDITFLRKSSTNGVIHETPCTRYARYHVRRLAHESAMDLVARGIEDVRAAYKKQENSRGVGWPRRGKGGERRRSTLVAYIFYGAITGNPYLRFVQFCPSVQPSLFPTFFSSPPLCLRVYARLTLSPSALERFANDYL